MKLPLHLLRLQPAPHARDREPVYLMTRSEISESRKTLFRAPALPTLQPQNREVPFNVNRARACGTGTDHAGP